MALFSDLDFGGVREALRGDDPDLSDNAIGNDALSSIRIPQGVQVVVYEHSHYRGRAELLTGDVINLRHSAVGNDSVSSIRVIRADGHGSGRDVGVVLFEHEQFGGRGIVLMGDQADLARSGLGNDALSSLRVPRGCRVTLFENDHFRGRREVFTHDDADLRNNAIGSDRASSIRIEWVGRDGHRQ